MNKPVQAINRRLLAPNNQRLVLVDIGASGGMQRPWKSHRDTILWVAFDADEDASGKLAGNLISPDTIVIPSAVGERSENRDLYITQRQGHSSLLMPSLKTIGRYPFQSRYDVVKVRKVQVEPLDKLLAQKHIGNIDFIKIDTQGTELEILKGAVSTLVGTFGVEVEVEFVELYQRQPLFAEVDTFMRQKGFELIDIKRHHELRQKWQEEFPGSGGQLVSADALYIKPYSEYIEQWIGHLETDVLRVRVAKAVCICIIYGLLDLAAEYADLTPIRILNKDAKDFLMESVNSVGSQRRSNRRFLSQPQLWLSTAIEKLHYRFGQRVVRKDSYLGGIRR